MISSDRCCRVVGLKHMAGLEPRDQLSRHRGQSREGVFMVTAAANYTGARTVTYKVSN